MTDLKGRRPFTRFSSGGPHSTPPFCSGQHYYNRNTGPKSWQVKLWMKVRRSCPQRCASRLMMVYGQSVPRACRHTTHAHHACRPTLICNVSYVSSLNVLGVCNKWTRRHSANAAQPHRDEHLRLCLKFLDEIQTNSRRWKKKCPRTTAPKISPGQ